MINHENFHLLFTVMHWNVLSVERLFYGILYSNLSGTLVAVHFTQKLKNLDLANEKLKEMCINPPIHFLWPY